MNPLRDISPPHSPLQSQSNLTPVPSHWRHLDVDPVDNRSSSSIAHQQETQNNLRQASVALDAAYERVTQLRHNINSLLNRMPPEIVDGRSSESVRDNNGDTPQRVALTRSGAFESDMDFNMNIQRLRTIISPSARQRLEDFESTTGRMRGSASEHTLETSRNRQQRRDPSADPPTQPHPPRTRSPPPPDLIIPERNRNAQPSSPEERSPFRRDFGIISPDDPSTMIGRRVAARAAVASSEPQTALPLEQQLQDQTALIARDLAGLASRLVLRGVRRVEATRQADSQQPALNNVSETVRAPSESNMDWEATPPQTYHDLLQDFINGSSTASSNTSTYPHPSSDMNRRRSSERMSQRGEDQNPPSWPRRQPPPHYSITSSWPRQETTAGETTTSFEEARYNADGDEIDSDDDEIERDRPSRLQFVPDSTVPSILSQSDEDFFLPFASSVSSPSPSSSSTTIQSLDNESEAIRVRINAHQDSKDTFFLSSPSRTYPRHVDPLPTPISKMLRHPAVPTKFPRFIPVSTHASFAGR